VAKRGGARPNAGRKLGSVSKRSTELIADAVASGITPVEFMLEILRDESADMKRREWAAEKVAPYIHGRPAPVAHRVTIDLPATNTIQGIANALAKITAETAAGRIAPAEAQSLIAIIEAQRKAIETRELVERLERLERLASVASRGV
jgi:hypothetical protein